MNLRPTFFLCLALAAHAAFAAQPADDLATRKIAFASVPRTTVAPQIDGDLGDPCWRTARELTGFRLTAGDRSQPVRFPTTARLLFDDTHLYVAFECIEPDPARLKSAARLHDDPRIEYDDRVEVFLDLGHDHRHYWELAVNPAGTQFDQAAFYRLHGSRTCDFFPEKNLFWRAKTRISADRWTVEIAIDVTSLGIPRLEEGTTWGFNLARVCRPTVKEGDELYSRPPGEGAEYSAWVPVQDYIVETISNFHAPREFGDLVMGDPGFAVEEFRLPSANYAFGPVGRPTQFGWNPLEVKLRPGGPGSRPLAAELEVRRPDGSVAWKLPEAAALPPSGAATLRYWIDRPGENQIVVRIIDAASRHQLYRTSYVEEAPPFIEFDLTPLYARHPAVVAPMKYRLLVDPQTLAKAELQLSVQAAGDRAAIAATTVRDLAGATQLTPVFDIEKLRALPGGDYVVDCRLREKDGGRILGEFRQVFTKYAPEVPARFGAERTTHSYAGVAADAIRVQFPFAAQFVFWRGANYVPWWEIDGVAMSNQFVEAWGGGDQGCNEPMQDRECRYSRVELLESSPARAVVHWRYALGDAHYRIYHNEWVDEYYTFYPDGAGVRRVELWANSDTQHEVFDTLLVKPPGARTAQLFDPEYATLANLRGERHSMPEFSRDRPMYQRFLRTGSDFIAEFDFKDRMHPFTVFAFRDDLLPGVSPGMVSVARAVFQGSDQRGHWPLARYPIDGYNAVGLDVPTHFSFGNMHTEVSSARQPNAWMFLIGAAAPGSGVPEAQAQAWLHPASLTVDDPRQATSRGYDPAQRAYQLAVAAGASHLSLHLAADRAEMFHPVFLLDAGAAVPSAVTVNGRRLPAGEFATGRTRAGAVVVFLGVAVPNGATIDLAFPGDR